MIHLLDERSFVSTLVSVELRFLSKRIVEHFHSHIRCILLAVQQLAYTSIDQHAILQIACFLSQLQAACYST